MPQCVCEMHKQDLSSLAKDVVVDVVSTLDCFELYCSMLSILELL